jgi:hypothetical protein
MSDVQPFVRAQTYDQCVTEKSYFHQPSHSSWYDIMVTIYDIMMMEYLISGITM